MKHCEHEHIQYDKINDYNYCQDCMQVFRDEISVLVDEDKVVVDEIGNNLLELNNL